MESKKTIKILVTGSKGFLGMNLIEKLSSLSNIEIFTFDKEDTFLDLSKYLKKSDIIFHFAATQRSENEKDFYTVNIDLTNFILTELKSNNNHCNIFFTSSIHADKNTPFGISKRTAESLILEYGNISGVNVYVIRLSNIFGPFSKPNFNNVTATFAYNIVNEIPINIFNPTQVLNLIYVEDILELMTNKIEEFITLPSCTDNKIEYFPETINLTVSELLYVICEIAIGNSKYLNYKRKFLQNIESTYNYFLTQKKEH